MTNPWIARHIDDESAYQPRWLARKLVLLEFAGCPDPTPCECGGTAWFRATVGSLMCPDCRRLYYPDGEPRGGGPAPGVTIL